MNGKNRISLIAMILVTAASALAFAADPADDELIKRLAPAFPSAESDADAPSKIDAELKKSLGGEDVGEPGDPLIRIGEQMRTCEELLGRKDHSASTLELQKQIVADLERLMQQVKSQKSSQGGGKSGGGGKKTSQGGGAPKDDAAQNSTERLRDDQARKAQMGNVKKTLENLWGDLPERLRDEALQSLGDTFLPKYDLQIRKYFERLGEEPAGK